MSRWSGFMLVLMLTCAAAGERLDLPHVMVEYAGIDSAHARGLGEVVSAAHEVYVKQFAADMPERIDLSVKCGPGEATRLFNDGADRVVLSIPSEKVLAPPQQSGTYVLYGMCHELGHLAMYRTLKDRDWMTAAAAEGWADFAGSVVVDDLYAKHGPSLWPEPYDYREDGSARLKQVFKFENDAHRAALAWMKLDSILGRENFVKLFAAWQRAKPDPTSARALLRESLLAVDSAKSKELGEWWDSNQQLLVMDRPVSAIAKVEISASKFTGKPVELGGDDGSADGRKSIAGGGHARLFAAPAEGVWYLRGIFVHGGRYGPPRAPDTTFEISLCDEQMRPIATWKKPYAVFDRGESKWVSIELPPTQVPGSFFVCLNFRPTARSGVFVSFDASTRGHSRVATPGQPGQAMDQSDWMIRAQIDRPTGADPLQR